MSNLKKINHPLVEHHLARLRDKTVFPDEFRTVVYRLSTLLTYEACQDLSLKPAEVDTPLCRTRVSVLDQQIALVPILRAGLGMVEPVLHLMPTAQVWHLGFYRDETTHQPVEYYKKLPHGSPVDIAFVLDPMLATGGSAIAALKALKGWGVPKIHLLALIASPEGIAAVHDYDTEVCISVCAIDEGLNDNAFIVPGLGDAGDRIFNASPEFND